MKTPTRARRWQLKQQAKGNCGRCGGRKEGPKITCARCRRLGKERYAARKGKAAR